MHNMEKNIATVYEDQFSERSAQCSTYVLNSLTHYLPKNKDCLILDAGCGDGIYSKMLRNKGYCKVISMDLFDNPPSKENIVEYQQGSIVDTPFEDNSFDFIFCNSVLHYLTDPQDGLIELKRICKPNAIIFFTVHTKYSPSTLVRLIKRTLKLGVFEHLIDLNFKWSLGYIKLIKNNGLQIVDIDGYFDSIFLSNDKTTLKHLIKKKTLSSRLAIKKYWKIIRSILGYHAIIVVKK